MRKLRLNTFARLGGGLVVLLLLALERKVCPWLTAQPSVLDPQPWRAGSQQGPAAPNQSNEGANHRRPRALPFLLPDAVAAPRWPAAWQPAAWPRTVGWHDGVVSCGDRDGHPRPADSAAFTPPSTWRDLRPCTDFTFPGLTAAQRTPPVDPAVTCSLVPTGPPAA